MIKLFSLVQICKKYNIPTAQFGVFRTATEAYKYLKNANMPIVVKADGLAAGKGVYICEDLESSNKAVQEIFNGKFGLAEQVLIEEFLQGDEMSYFILSDGKIYKKFNLSHCSRVFFLKTYIFLFIGVDSIY